MKQVWVLGRESQLRLTNQWEKTYFDLCALNLLLQAGQNSFPKKSIVYIFTRDPEPGTTYTLIVSGDTRDREGLRTGADFRISFTSDIPFLNVLSFAANSSVIDIASMTDNVIPVQIDSATGELNFSIHFSLLFGLEEKSITPQRIMLSAFFPRTLAPAALQYVNWTSGDRLFMRWEGLSASSGENPHYYRLAIPGGRGGISPGSNIFMKEDLILYLAVSGRSDDS